MIRFSDHPADSVTDDSAVGLEAEINKRLTLNLLIQGAAQHAFLTSHYLVRDELNAISPVLLRLYDQFAATAHVQSWVCENYPMYGWPDRFWRRTAHPKHPFRQHAFLARYGMSLATAAKRRARERCRQKKVTTIPVLFSLQYLKTLIHVMIREYRHKAALTELAKHATHLAWGIAHERLSGRLTRDVAFGAQRSARTFHGVVLRASAAGYGGVMLCGSELRVVARAWNWPILAHELAKGTVELICLHGLNELDDVTYGKTMKAADRIENEPWMLQVGPELWRQILPLLPTDRKVAEMVMHMARLPAASLERLMYAVIEDPAWARELFAGMS